MPPLDGIRVLDLSRVLAGPYCTMLLADLGADVIKVERPGEGDETRTWGPPYVGGESAYFLAINRGKRCVALDLARPEAQEALAAARPPGRRRRRELPAGHGRAARRRLRAARAREPEARLLLDQRLRRRRPGYDFMLQAESGLMAITGEADGPPLKVGVAVVDVLAGYAAATAILAALVAGGGERIEISLYDVALSALVNVAQGALVTGEEPARHGNAHPSIVPYETFAAADGLVAVAAANDGLFRAAVRGARAARPGRGRALRHEPGARRAPRRSSTASSTRSSPRAPPTNGSSGSARPACPVGKVRGVLEALARRTTLTVEHPTLGALPLVALAARRREEAAAAARRAHARDPRRARRRRRAVASARRRPRGRAGCGAAPARTAGRPLERRSSRAAGSRGRHG